MNTKIQGYRFGFLKKILFCTFSSGHFQVNP